MYNIEYFIKDGKEPAREWIKSRDGSVRANIYSRLKALEKDGENLIGTKSLLPITGDTDFYEFRNLTFKWRLGLYYNRSSKTFILFHGWVHEEAHEEEHKRNISKARAFLYEYLHREN